MRRFLACLLLASLASGPSLADLYKWVDENGKVHYTDTPPPGKKAKRLDLKVPSITGAPVISTVSGPSPSPGAAAVQTSVKIYTTTWCGYCKRAKAYMQARGVRFEELDVETSSQGQVEFRSIGGRGVPVILVGNQRMDGYSQESLDAMLRQAGL